MKRPYLYVSLLLTVVLASFSLAFTSCNDDDPDDQPLNTWFEFYFQNEEGLNLLDPSTPDNLVGKLEANLTYNGTAYNVNWEESAENYGACKFPYGTTSGNFYGIWYETHVGSDNHLQTGFWNMGSNFDINFTLELPQYDKKYDINWKFDKNSRHNTITVNGTNVLTSPEMTILLP